MGSSSILRSFYPVLIAQFVVQPVRVTPEAYYLFETPAAGVPELCDAFKVRCVVSQASHDSDIILTTILAIFTSPKIWAVVAQVVSAVRHPTVAARQLARQDLVHPQQDTRHRVACQFVTSGEHPIRTVPRLQLHPLVLEVSHPTVQGIRPQAILRDLLTLPDQSYRKLPAGEAEQGSGSGYPCCRYPATSQPWRSVAVH